MALSVTHSTVVVVPDDGTSPVGTNEWNATHTLSGAVDVANGGTGATTAAGAAANLGLLGKQSIPVPAAAMTANTTGGATANTLETTTNKNMFVTMDFANAKSAQFSIIMPISWDEGTITFVPVWSHAATTTNFGVVWELSAVAVSDDDPGDVAFGTGQTSTDTGGTTNDIYIGPESSAITVAGSPQAGDFVMFKVARTSGSIAVDARLHAIKLNMTIAAGNDA